MAQFRIDLGATCVGASDNWAESRVTISNRLGLHARPAMSFVDIANGFSSDIRVAKGDQDVDGKSIMQMMMLGATQGTELTLRAQGTDADEALAALGELVSRNFDEDEETLDQPIDADQS